MSSIKWNSDKIMSMSALFVSMAMLASMVYQAKIMREHEENSSFPKLELWNNNNSTSYKLVLINTGLGPAIIESVQVAFEDSTYYMDHAQFIYHYIDSLENSIPFRYANLMEGQIIQPGEKIELLTCNKDSSRNNVAVDLFYFNKAKMLINYSSVYKQHWRLNGLGSIPQILTEEPKVIDQLLGN